MVDPQNPEEQTPDTRLRADKLDRLIRDRNTTVTHNPKWSRFVRRTRLVLPLIALALFAVVFVWSDVQQNKIIPVQDMGKTPTIGKNELVNPRFESTDEDNQPFTITAKRAVQDTADDNLVMLEEPLADMLLNSGDWVAAKSSRGSFRQNNKMLLLRGNVRLYHDKGYELVMEELDVDLQANTALSKVDVTGHGPEGTLEAKGLQGTATTGHIIFNGPAKLVLTNVSGGSKEMIP